MKAFSLYIAIFALILLLVPMIALNFEIEPALEVQPPVHDPTMPQSAQEDTTGQIPEDDTVADMPLAADKPDDEPDEETRDEEEGASVQVFDDALFADAFLIMDESTGEVVEVELRDFVRGAVAAEMPVSFHLEALKAQAVAAHTYALHNRQQQREAPDANLKGADFAADPSERKVYMTEQQAREFYGERADASWKKICEAADSVLNEVLIYNGEPIVAAYHAISSGQTEDAANVWVGSAPYLTPAESEGDLLAPNYESTAVFSAEEVAQRIAGAYPEIALDDDPDSWFGEFQRSGSGYITEIRVGDTTLHGKDIRELFELRSHNFDIFYTDAGFAFTTYGYGHGVGLSQYGADFLARQGYTYDRILANYYDGAALVELDQSQD